MGYRQRKGHVGAVTAGWREAGACGGDGLGGERLGQICPRNFCHIFVATARGQPQGGSCLLLPLALPIASLALPFASLVLPFACFAFPIASLALPFASLAFAFCFLCFAHRFPCFCKIMGGEGWLLGYSLYFCCRKNNNYKTTLSCKQSEPLFLLFFACRPPLAAWPTRNNRRLVSNKRLVVQMPAILSLV